MKFQTMPKRPKKIGAARLIDQLLQTMEDKGECIENPGYLFYQMLVFTATPKFWGNY
jgi:hypothetical protein